MDMVKSNNILSIQNLKVVYKDSFDYTALKNFTIDVYENDALGIVGESGSGKTTVAMSILRLIDEIALTDGDIIYNEKFVRKFSDKEITSYRGLQIGFCPQNSLEALNPLMKIGDQISEGMRVHLGYSDYKLIEELDKLCALVGLSTEYIEAYPHQLSGGLRQKALLAISLSCNPKILIVDEPTSSLDVDSKEEILNLLKNLRQTRKMTLIVISHDMEIIRRLCNRCAVLYQGELIEIGEIEKIIDYPEHPYTRGLLSSSIEVNPYQDLWGIPGEMGLHDLKGCSFYSRCTQSISICKDIKPRLENISKDRKVACNRGGIIKVLSARGLSKRYKIGKRYIDACINADIDLRAGEIISIVGKSGSGKTTLVSMICGVLEKDKGEVQIFDELLKCQKMHRCFHGLQMVFQDPYSSINHEFDVEKAVTEPLLINKLCTKEEAKISAKKALLDVGLSSEDCFLSSRITSLSGGQRQRIAIARAMVMKPKILIADEISSMLDPSSKANILRLMKKLQNQNGFSMIYVTHDLHLARKISNRTYEVNEGRVIEKNICFLKTTVIK